ncbi:MAG: multiheme c-type cytochrome, partial [Salinimicrobium sp.]
MSRKYKILRRSQHQAYPIIICIFLLCCCLFSGCRDNKKDEYINVSKQENHDGFIGSKNCVTCHSQEYNGWKGSMHDLAMKIADSSTVLGDFNDFPFEHKAVVTRFFKKGEKFFVNTEGPDGEYHDYEVTYTFGVSPLQQYLVKFPKGQFQVLLSAWNSEKNKWFSLEHELEVTHEDWLHWTGGAMRWNTMCADCHSTNLEKNFNPVSEEYQTTFSEINVACEACHGPGEAHASYYEKELEEAGPPPELYMNSKMSSTEIVEKCARCHSRRAQLTQKFDYNGHFLDHYAPELLVYPTYEYDGQIRDEDYVYGSFLQSKMYHSGVSCIDCHDVHTTKIREPGNNLCLGCHDNSFNMPSHHMHKENSDAALCVNCHMTGKTYMGNDFRRDHSFRIPRPDQTVLYGTPNACNSCHTERSAEWASKKIAENFGEDRTEHFSDLLIPGQLGDRSALKKLIRNYKYPDISRATAVRLLATGSLTSRDLVFLRQYQKDKSPLVRNEIVKALSNYQTSELTGYIDELLRDSIRLVRINAARASLMNQIPVLDSLAYSKATNEYLQFLDMNSDFPSGQHELALFYESFGKIEEAIDAY